MVGNTWKFFTILIENFLDRLPRAWYQMGEKPADNKKAFYNKFTLFFDDR